MEAIKLSGPRSTLAIMEWVDQHPEVKLQADWFEFDRNSALIVSDEDPHNPTWILADEGHPEFQARLLPNGWERVSSSLGWHCRKNGRAIFITD